MKKRRNTPTPRRAGLLCLPSTRGSSVRSASAQHSRLALRALQLVRELQRLPAHVVRKLRMEDALDGRCFHAAEDGFVEIEHFLESTHVIGCAEFVCVVG